MKPTLLLIMDGWGIAPAGPGNATSLARTPNLDRLTATCPHSQLKASGRAVGLPEGYMGNSEVGHLNIGAGRVVYQDMTRIDMAMEDGTLETNPVFVNVVQETLKAHGRLHFAGLLSDGGVHSHIHHLIALCRAAAGAGVPILVHCFMDGRDTPPSSGKKYITQLQDALKDLKNAHIAALYGRFYAMDRDKRWERVKQAFDLFCHGEGPRKADALGALDDSYKEGVTDEFVKPVWVSQEEPGLKDGDGVFFFNFRADRMREIVSALTSPDFSGFDRGTLPKLAGAASMTSYDAALTIPVAFPDQDIPMVLGEVVSRAGLRQLRLAETEKYAHVTYFFNGGVETPNEGEARTLIPSPKVATYDLQPEMSAPEVCEKLVGAIKSQKYDVIIINFANPDMVGHTGVEEAAIKAVEAVDECVGKAVEAIKEVDGVMFICADHGNAEQLIDYETGAPFTAHTTNQVPFILVNYDPAYTLRDGGCLADIVPTLIETMGMKQPAEMTGKSLLIKK